MRDKETAQNMYWECDITLINTVKFDSEEERMEFNKLVKEIK